MGASRGRRGEDAAKIQDKYSKNAAKTQHTCSKHTAKIQQHTAKIQQSVARRDTLVRGGGGAPPPPPSHRCVGGETPGCASPPVKMTPSPRRGGARSAPRSTPPRRGDVLAFTGRGRTIDLATCQVSHLSIQDAKKRQKP